MRVVWIALLPLFLAASCAPLTPRPRAEAALQHPLRVRHPGLHAEGPAACTLTELKDERGFPRAYRMDVESVICPEQTCKRITVTLTWDALGRYRSLALPPGETLEKGLPAALRPKLPQPPKAWKGVPFTEADYRKLDAILKDDHSLLKTQKLDGVAKAQAGSGVDGITGATPETIRESVVEGASLTCYNLWHWANGDAAAAARELTHRQCCEALLLGLLASEEPHEVLFALEHLRLHACFGPQVVKAVEARLVRGGGREQLDLGLAYLRAALPERSRYGAEVGAVIGAADGEGRAYLIDKLGSEPELPPALFEAACARLSEWPNYFEVHLFLQLAERRRYASPALVAQAAALLERPDFFIARRAHAYLSAQPALDAALQKRLQAFRDKAAREGRSL